MALPFPLPPVPPTAIPKILFTAFDLEAVDDAESFGLVVEVAAAPPGVFGRCECCSTSVAFAINWTEEAAEAAEAAEGGERAAVLLLLLLREDLDDEERLLLLLLLEMRRLCCCCWCCFCKKMYTGELSEAVTEQLSDFVKQHLTVPKAIWSAMQ